MSALAAELLDRSEAQRRKRTSRQTGHEAGREADAFVWPLGPTPRRQLETPQCRPTLGAAVKHRQQEGQRQALLGARSHPTRELQSGSESVRTGRLLGAPKRPCQLQGKLTGLFLPTLHQREALQQEADRPPSPNPRAPIWTTLPKSQGFQVVEGRPTI